MNTNKIGQRMLVGACILCLAACSSKTAQEKGAEMATTKLDMATGIGDTLQAKGGQAGESVLGGIGALAKGMERGWMKSGRSIVVDPTLAAAGLTVTKIQDADAGGAREAHGLSAYVVSTLPVKGTLRVLVFDAMNQEIGRTSVQLDRGADEAKYEILALDAEIKQFEIRKVAFAFKPAASS